MAYLRLILNRKRRQRLPAHRQCSPAQAGASTLEALGNFANARHCSLSQACSRIGNEHIPRPG